MPNSQSASRPKTTSLYKESIPKDSQKSQGAKVYNNPNTKTEQKKMGLLERKAKEREAVGLPPKGKEVYHAEKNKKYFLSDDGRVFFQRKNGVWKETPNIETINEVKYISENGNKKLVDQKLSDDQRRKKELREYELKQNQKKDTYKMDHVAPDKNNGVRSDNVTDAFSDDIYSSDAIRLHGHGDMAMDSESISVINRIKDNPDADVTIYRAIPKDIDANINPKDWVTISKLYAKDHGEGPLKGNYKIIEKNVKAREIYTDGNSIHEWGYDPKIIPK